MPLAPDEKAGFVMTLLRMLAFAPLAALNTQRLHGQIDGTQLHDVPVNNKQIDNIPTVSEENSPASVSEALSETASDATTEVPVTLETEIIEKKSSSITAADSKILNDSSPALQESQSVTISDEPPPPWETGVDDISYEAVKIRIYPKKTPEMLRIYLW